MASNQSGNPQAAGRLELLIIVGVVICTTSNLLLSMSHRVMDQVAVNSAGPTVGLDFWQNLPEDVLELELRIEVQGALLEQILKLHEADLQPPDDGSRTAEEQERVDDRLEAALAQPTRALRVIQEARAARIEELKSEYLSRRINS